MAWDWKSLVCKVAPTIGAALGGPLVGQALSAVSQAILGRPDGTEEELAQCLQTATPEQLLALKQADNEFKVRMKELEVDVFSLEVEDRKSARDRQAKTGDKTPAVLVYILTVMIGLTVAALVFIEMPEANKTALDIMLGNLVAAWLMAIKFYYGTSRGSEIKTMAMVSEKGRG